MINFLFGLFQSLNGLRYTLWVLWRLKVNIWFCLPSLQFTDKYQVLYFSCRLPEIKVSFLEKKKGGETDRAQQAAFTQSILRYPVAEMNSNFSVKKGKGACHTLCHTLRCFSYYHCLLRQFCLSIVPTHKVKEFFSRDIWQRPKTQWTKWEKGHKKEACT